MKQELLPRPDYPATAKLVERVITIACYAVLTSLWIRRHVAHKPSVDRSRSIS